MKVDTVFGHTVDVDEAEAAALARGGLVRSGPVEDREQVAPELVTVVPVFTREPMDVPPDEAESLARAGLLVPEEPAAEVSDEPPAEQDMTKPARKSRTPKETTA